MAWPIEAIVSIIGVIVGLPPALIILWSLVKGTGRTESSSNLTLRRDFRDKGLGPNNS